MTNFWRTATTEQKLAQLDGALELGMTSVQCGMNVGATAGATAGAVKMFAYSHGRHFPANGEGASRKRLLNGLKHGHKGGTVTGHIALRRSWEKAGFDLANAKSARLFDEEERDTGNLFDPRPDDMEAFA